MNKKKTKNISVYESDMGKEKKKTRKTRKLRKTIRRGKVLVFQEIEGGN